MKFDITKTYPPVVWWLYDHVIADGVQAMNAGLVEELSTALPDGSRVLDVGCGGGQLALELSARNPGLRIVGVDADPGQVRRAARRVVQRADRLRFERASADRLPFPDDSFDAVVSVGSVKHWPDAAAGMAEMVRVLRPGGLLRVLEADRSTTLADARITVGCLQYPRPLRGLGARFFRACVAGPGVSLDNARALLRGLPVEQARIAPVPQAPAIWQISARGYAESA
ncbi:class I SAM-dependent methyltransferase [Nocardia sp. NPDC127579]|uniref:class I SAM-dependent methyltransferase n=1 Tax=Nocardia sp. NPDC127579 TaxID=3345402 RepID=UPI00362B4AC0